MRVSHMMIKRTPTATVINAVSHKAHPSDKYGHDLEVEKDLNHPPLMKIARIQLLKAPSVLSVAKDTKIIPKDLIILLIMTSPFGRRPTILLS